MFKWKTKTSLKISVSVVIFSPCFYYWVKEPEYYNGWFSFFRPVFVENVESFCVLSKERWYKKVYKKIFYHQRVQGNLRILQTLSVNLWYRFSEKFALNNYFECGPKKDRTGAVSWKLVVELWKVFGPIMTVPDFKKGLFYWSEGIETLQTKLFTILVDYREDLVDVCGYSSDIK